MPALTLTDEMDSQTTRTKDISKKRSRMNAEQLPGGVSKQIDSKLVWSGADMSFRLEEVFFSLSNADIKEIDSAVHFFLKRRLPINQISPENFPLPSLSEKLAILKETLHNGRGVFVIRGLNPNQYTKKENNALQQSHGEEASEAMLQVHLMDIDREVYKLSEEVYLAPANKTVEVGFHNDGGDNVSLYCRHKAARGGDLLLSSAATIYEELAHTNPGILKTLMRPWQWQLMKTGAPEIKVTYKPIMYCHEGRVIMAYNRRALTGLSEEAPRDPRLEPLTRAQLEAIKAVDKLACKNAIAITQQPGDMLFFNNLGIIHARSSFTDDKCSPQAKRHLQRIVCRDEKLAWGIPEALKLEWEILYDHDRSVEVFPLEPAPWKFQICGHG